MLFPILATDMPNPVEHVIDKPLWQEGLFYKSEWLISNVTVMLVLSGVVCFFVLAYAASRIRTGTSNTINDYRAHGFLANFVETVCVYLRNQVFRPVLGDATDKYAPFLWTLFWFILTCNLLGLLPIADVTSLIGQMMGKPIGHHGHGIGGTATQSIWVTGGLALVSFLVINISGLMKDTAGYFKHLTGGAPVFLWPIMIPIEILGTFVKPFALAMRLFANMTGGHIVLAVLLSFVYLLVHGMGLVVGGVISFGPLFGSLFVYSLELLVGFIQAFIFTFLTCLFIGQLIVHHGHDDHAHDDHAGHDHSGHDHAGHDHGHAH